MSADTILTLEDNITIRRWRDGDEAEIVQHANNKKIWRNVTDRFPHPYTVEDAKQWIRHSKDVNEWLSVVSPNDIKPDESKEDFATRRARSTMPTDYAICHNDLPIGGCGCEHDPKAPRTVSIGYWLGEEYWGRGIATQIARAFVKWIFDTFLWIVRIEGDAYSWNEGSQKVLKKAGFQYEGLQKMKACKDGHYGDVVMFGQVRPGFAGEVVRTDAT